MSDKTSEPRFGLASAVAGGLFSSAILFLNQLTNSETVFLYINRLDALSQNSASMDAFSKVVFWLIVPSIPCLLFCLGLGFVAYICLRAVWLAATDKKIRSRFEVLADNTYNFAITSTIVASIGVALLSLYLFSINLFLNGSLLSNEVQLIAYSEVAAVYILSRPAIRKHIRRKRSGLVYLTFVALLVVTPWLDVLMLRLHGTPGYIVSLFDWPLWWFRSLRIAIYNREMAGPLNPLFWLLMLQVLYQRYFFIVSSPFWFYAAWKGLSFLRALSRKFVPKKAAFHLPTVKSRLVKWTVKVAVFIGMPIGALLVLDQLAHVVTRHCYSLHIQTDKPVYLEGETALLTITPRGYVLATDTRFYNGPPDPRGHGVTEFSIRLADKHSTLDFHVIFLPDNLYEDTLVKYFFQMPLVPRELYDDDGRFVLPGQADHDDVTIDIATQGGWPSRTVPIRILAKKQG